MMANLKDLFSQKDQKQSVYDDALDNTDPDFGKSQAYASRSSDDTQSTGSLGAKRWKYGGPSLPAMKEGDFDLYVTKAIRSRKEEFRKFMIERLVDKRVRDERIRSKDRFARQLSAHRIQQIRQEVEQNYEVEEKRLREEHARKHLGSELTAAIYEFLDLPDVLTKTSNTKTQNLADSLMSNLSSGNENPATTHPAAGLSHLRSNAVLDNHPLWGPQAERTPVLARVVRPRVTIGGQDSAAYIGVGGIVTREKSITAGSSWPRDRFARREEGLPVEEQWLDANRMTQEIDPDLPNGNKIWVQPEAARIDAKGNIMLNTSRSSKEAIAVKTAKEEPILEATSTTIYTQPPLAPAGTWGNANYGFGLPDRRRLKGRTNFGITGFDEELKQTPGQGKGTENEIMARIREIADK
jgi:hypothetical protein